MGARRAAVPARPRLAQPHARIHCCSPRNKPGMRGVTRGTRAPPARFAPWQSGRVYCGEKGGVPRAARRGDSVRLRGEEEPAKYTDTRLHARSLRSCADVDHLAGSWILGPHKPRLVSQRGSKGRSLYPGRHWRSSNSAAFPACSHNSVHGFRSYGFRTI